MTKSKTLGTSNSQDSKSPDRKLREELFRLELKHGPIEQWPSDMKLRYFGSVMGFLVEKEKQKEGDE